MGTGPQLGCLGISITSMVNSWVLHSVAALQGNVYASVSTGGNNMHENGFIKKELLQKCKSWAALKVLTCIERHHD